MKICSAVPENGCLVFCGERKKQKQNKTDKNICKTYTHPPHRRLRKLLGLPSAQPTAPTRPTTNAAEDTHLNNIVFNVRLEPCLCLKTSITPTHHSLVRYWQHYFEMFDPITSIWDVDFIRPMHLVAPIHLQRLLLLIVAICQLSFQTNICYNTIKWTSVRPVQTMHSSRVILYYTVWVKHPEVFWLFPQTVGNF